VKTKRIDEIINSEIILFFKKEKLQVPLPVTSDFLQVLFGAYLRLGTSISPQVNAVIKEEKQKAAAAAAVNAPVGKGFGGGGVGSTIPGFP
jgi:hypothetical protein